MKAVAPDAFLIERVGQREGLLDLGRSAVKGGIACPARIEDDEGSLALVDSGCSWAGRCAP